MISIKTPREIELLRIAGEITGSTHNYLKQFIKPGITTKELDKLAEDYILSRGATPSFKGYGGFPGSVCTSINEEVVHGIPSNRKLKNGDIISIDIGACYHGYHGDSAWTYPVGTISKEKEKLLKGTEEALFAGLSVIKAGIRVHDIGYAVSKCANKYKFGVVKELVGHGVGNRRALLIDAGHAAKVPSLAAAGLDVQLDCVFDIFFRIDIIIATVVIALYKIMTDGYDH